MEYLKFIAIFIAILNLAEVLPKIEFKVNLKNGTELKFSPLSLLYDSCTVYAAYLLTVFLVKFI